ncbi:uncharacterized protein [Apostichopus japonicus]|uniref:uncharacterized protein n=1 Tax=Stichopus japonicus TaxID=307972 RepID=UPI003AB28F85
MDLNVCMGKKKVTGRSLLFVCFFMIILLNICKAVNCTEQSDCTVEHPLVGQQLILKCDVNNVLTSVWKWENEFLYAGTTPITTDNNIDLLEDTYSLNLHTVHISNDGRYVCKDDNGNHIDYCVEVLSVPSIMIFVDDLNELPYFEGISGKEYNVTCKVIATKPVLNMTWTVNDVLINSARLVTENKDNPHTFDMITSMTYNGNGSDDIFNCTSSRENFFSVEKILHMKTYDYSLSLTVNNETTLWDDKVSASSMNLIKCQPVEQNFLPNVTLSVTVELGSGSRPVANVSTFDENNLISYMAFPRNTLRIWIRCSLKTRKVNKFVEKMLVVVVLPELRLQVGNVNVTRGDITVSVGESLVIQCIAFSARSVGVFLWTTSDGHVISGAGDVKMRFNRFYTGTYDVEDKFIFSPRRSGVLSCTHQTEDHEESTVSLNVIIMNDNNSENNNMNLLAISLIVSSVAAVFVIAMCFRRVKGLHAHANVRFDHQQEAIGTLPGTMTLTGRRPPSMKLPEKPSKQTSLEVPDFDDERYHSLFDDAPEASIIDRKRVCLLTRISEGVIFQRWMGTFTKSQGRKEYITISLRNDTINQSRYNWEMFAKKIIELPGCRHIAECVGLCLDGDKLLVLQTYSHSVDLHSYLSEDNNADESNLISRRLQLASQILLGMEFLVSHGLAHPGLTTKKIRMTEEKVCQLYDFCHREEASRVLEDMKKEDGFSSICHSPEALARNEHDLGSDVWYTAFTIWEVLYTNDTISTEIDATYAKAIIVHEDKMPCFTKPPFCPEPLFAILTDCWKLKSSEPPLFSKLRSVFQDEGALSLTDHLPELLAVPSDDDVSSANSYESMKGHTRCT